MTIERFLIVDNTDANILFFQMLLQGLEIPEPIVSPTGDDAMNIVEAKHPQFIIACWELNGMPGTIFIQKARAKKKRKYIPCIIYSKRMSEEDVKLTKELGFQHILAMPCYALLGQLPDGDLLAVDDLQFLAGKKATIVEFQNIIHFPPLKKIKKHQPNFHPSSSLNFL